ncbi:dienelactone hydrolase family protein [Thermocrispum sp.]|jgi:carboxymethylenebutenolidase|uniref:Dienelactone hydrolase n=1 Tax=Thermocrispum agreste TaxID=37925 RepID=A0A2W4J9L0_9PSEU|nr:dienelactone hydrolase family protein [Thermocrispum sp.]PZM94695.1 MAG: dienelactone hydrolase [Thermocrispum agreste]
MATSGRRIEITTADGTAEAYLSHPEGGTYPGVILFMDAIGLRPQIESMADRIAGWGYVVLAPNVFYRHGRAADLAPKGDLRRPGERERFMPAALRLVEQHTPDRAARDFEAYLAALRDVEHVRPGPIGTVGYCMGGRLALRAAAQAPDDVAAVGMFHVGGLVTDDEDSAHLCIPHVRAEVLAGYADQDGSMPQEAIEKVAADMAAAGVRYSGAVYSGARHGFTMADTSVYDEAAAERHYEELQALFRRTLG